MKKTAFACSLVFLLIGICSLGSAADRTEAVTASPGADGVQKVDVLAGEYFFKPGRIVVKVNKPVEIRISKESRVVPHDIIISAPEAGINVAEEIGRDPKVIRFTPTKTGSYIIYCSKKPPFAKSHQERGMEGVLEVVE